jgi:hypothetical protein
MNLILSSQMKHLMTVACGKTRHKFVGIYNGLDEAVWDPAHDPALPATYSFEHLSGKSICKGILRQELGLPLVDESVPLVSVQDFLLNYWFTFKKLVIESINSILSHWVEKKLSCYIDLLQMNACHVQVGCILYDNPNDKFELEIELIKAAQRCARGRAAQVGHTSIPSI